MSLSYVLVTAARNEEATLARTLDSVAGQTLLPRRWVVVSDASTDRTDDLVREFADRFDWIELLRRPAASGRDFGRKAACVRLARERVEAVPYDVIGNLDADVSFEPDYFAFLLGKFAADECLGVAGTAFTEPGSEPYDYRFTNIEHVSGQIQLFRRRCFEEIGGYVESPIGGVDWIAVTTARMRGWRTRTFPERRFVHHRRTGSASAGTWGAAFGRGEKDYVLGGHPLWQIFRAGYQAGRRPYLLGGAGLLLGYLLAALRRRRRPVSPELMRFHRREQMERLRARLLPGGKRGG